MTTPIPARLVLATTNAGKAREIRGLLPRVEVLTLTDVGFTDAIDEPFSTFAENARVKAETVFKATGIPALADDSGLCVDALGGAPGVHSARYAGEPQDAGRNMEKLLRAMEGESNRRARFVAALCLCTDQGSRIFEGTCEGTIADAPSGNGGFGYDPVFVPLGYNETFGMLSPEIKALVSHRAQALAKLVAAIRPE